MNHYWIRQIQTRADKSASAYLAMTPIYISEVSELVSDREDGAEWHRRLSKGRVDDVLDAAVLAYVAKQVDLQPRSTNPSYPVFPTEVAERDDILGTPMEIVCPSE